MNKQPYTSTQIAAMLLRVGLFSATGLLALAVITITVGAITSPRCPNNVGEHVTSVLSGLPATVVYVDPARCLVDIALEDGTVIRGLDTRNYEKRTEL